MSLSCTFSQASMKWEKLLPQQKGGGGEGEEEGPGKRWGHTCNAVKGGRFLYVFGGYGKENCQTNQVHVFDSLTQKWSQPVIKGTAPTPRDSHTCTTVGDNLFVFGGTDGANPLKDLHMLDTSSHTWVSPSIRGEGPEAREGHGAALVGKRLFIFGGCGKSHSTNDEVYFNDLYIFNTETYVWRRATTSGIPPSPRDSHTCSSWKKRIIVIGGEDGKHDNYLSDVHILDTDTLAWTELNTSDQRLPPRAGHSTVSFGKYLFVFGGFTVAQTLYDDLHMLDVDTGVWTKVITTGCGPSARFSVAGDSLDPQVGGVLMFIGGCDKELEALSDIYYLHTGLVRETDHRLEKLSLRKQLKLKCQEQNFTPINDKALVRAGTSSDIGQPMPLSMHAPSYRQNIPAGQSQTQGQRTFSAKVVESLPHGVMVETVIDGRLLRGILISTKSNSFQRTKEILDGIQVSVDHEGISLNGDCNKRQKTSSTSEPDVIDLQQADDVNGDESTPPVAHTNIATTHDSVNAVPEHHKGFAAFASPGLAGTPFSIADRTNRVTPLNASATTMDSVSVTPNKDDAKPAAGEVSEPAKLV